MKIIINHSSMVPIYEQIVDQIKTLIRDGELKENDNLPSVRSLSKELKISALTVKKAYDHLEEEGFTVTVHFCWRSRKKKWKPIWRWPYKKADDAESVMKISVLFLK